MKYLIYVFLLFLILILTSCSMTNNSETSSLTTSTENNTTTITNNRPPRTNYDGKTKQTGIISFFTTDIPTMSNKFIELIAKNYAGLTNELKEEFESYMVSRSPEFASFKYLNNSETSGNFIILGEFNGCVAFYDNPPAFVFEEVNLAGYSFGIGGRINIYKSQAWYMKIYDAYIRGLLTDENIRDLRELYIEFDTYLWQRESPQE